MRKLISKISNLINLLTEKVNIYQKTILFYLLTILLFTILLSLPISLTNNKDFYNFKKIFFISFGAFSHIKLLTINIKEDLTFFGQLIVLTLIFLKGIGFMTVTIFLLKTLRIIDLESSYRTYLSKERGGKDSENIIQIIKISGIILIVFQIILAFFIFPLIYFNFLKDKIYFHHFFPSVWAAIFHSVAATNNAGFDILGKNSLINYSHHYLFCSLLLLGSLVGGMGFPVIYEMFLYFKKKISSQKHFFSTYFKICILGTLVISLIGFLSILFIEYWYSFKETNQYFFRKIGFFNSFWEIFFSTLSTRTSGFSIIYSENFHPLSLVIQTILMFIGVCPSSTGGGVKVPSLIISFLGLKNFIQEKKHLIIFNKLISNKSQLFFLFSTLSSLTLIVVISTIISFDSDLTFFESFFNITSCYSCVGLSLGKKLIDYPPFGKLLIVITVLIGQLGVGSILNFKKSLSEDSIGIIKEDL